MQDHPPIDSIPDPAPAPSALVAALGYGGLLLLCFGVDRRLYARHQLQGWLPMRLRLTLVACASCLAAAWGLL